MPALAPTQRAPVDDRQESLFGDDFLETLEYLHIVARKILSGQLKAERRSRQKGVSVEFADHRPYSPGDDFRFIDWNVFFRTNQLFLKLFEEEEDLHIYLLLDCSGSVDFGQPYKFHYLRRLAAAIGYLGLASLDRVYVLPFSQSLPKGAAQTLSIRGKGKVFRLLHFLEKLKASGPTNLAACMKTFAGSRRKRGLAVVLSDCYDEAVIGGLNALRYQKFEVFVVHCVSPQEAEPELLGDLRLLDTETGRFREVTLTEGMLRRYRQAFGAWCANLEQFCRKNGLGYARCRTDTPFQDVIIRMLRRERFAVTFATPLALLGFALFIPVILLYLLKQRRRPVEISTLMFWDKILRDEQTVTSLTRLRKLLSLLLQLLFIALLTLAAARPSLSGRITGARRVVLLLDNSASMLVQEGSRTRFELARQKALGIVRGLSIGDTMMIVAVAAEADIVHPFTDSKKDLQEAIEQIQPTHGDTRFHKALQLVEQLPADPRETHVYLITDGAFDPVEINPPPGTRFAYLRTGDRADNVGISSFSVRPLPSSPRDFQVHIELTNDGEKDRRVPVELRVNGRLVDAFEYNVPAGRSITRTVRQFSDTGGEIEAVADVKDSFPLDNRAYAVLPRPHPIRVRLVTAEDVFLQQALATDEDVALEVVKPDQFTDGGGFVVTIFSGWHPAKTPAGNSIFIGNWPDDLGLKRRGELSKPIFTEWQRDHPVNRHLALQNVSIEKAAGVEPNAGFKTLASSFNEPLVLLKEAPGQTTLVITFGTGTSDLPMRVAFPIMIANAIRHLAGEENSERWSSPPIGSILTLRDLDRYRTATESGPGLRAVWTPDGRRIPVDGGRILVPVTRAGFYRAETLAGETNLLFAANLSNARECRIQPGDKLPLLSKTVIKEIHSGFRVGFEPWMVLTFLAVALSATEWVLFHRRVIE